MIKFLKSLSALFDTHGARVSKELQGANAGLAEAFAAHLIDLKRALTGVEHFDDSDFRPWDYLYLDSAVLPRFDAILADLTSIDAELPALTAMMSAPLQANEPFATAYVTRRVFTGLHALPELRLLDIHPSLGSRWEHDKGRQVFFSVGLGDGHARRDIVFPFVLSECPTSLSGFRELASSLAALVQTAVASRIRDPLFWPDEEEKREATRKFVTRETQKLVGELLGRVGYLERERIRELMVSDREVFMKTALASLQATFVA